jgi:predicted helicase
LEENTLKSSSLNKAKLKADKEKGKIYLDEQTTLKNIPASAWEYKLGNRSALDFIFNNLLVQFLNNTKNFIIRVGNDS